MKYGANINAKTTNPHGGITILELAIRQDSIEMWNEIRRAGIDTVSSHDVNFAFRFASDTLTRAIVEIVISKSIQVMPSPSFVSSLRNIQSLKTILGSKSVNGFDGAKLFSYAVVFTSKTISSQILSLFPEIYEINSPSYSMDESWKLAIRIAMKRGRVEEALTMLKYVKSIDQQYSSSTLPPILSYAVFKNQFSIVSYIVSNDLQDCGTTDLKGQIPLHVAARSKNLDIVKSLLSRKHDLNSIDNYGNAPIHLFVRNEFLDGIKLIVDAGANINQKNEARNDFTRKKN